MKIGTQNFRPCVGFKLTLKVLLVLKFLGQNGLKMCPKMVYTSKPRKYLYEVTAVRR